MNDFNLKTEIILIVASLALFIGFLFFPQYASNNIANWFKSSILDIESTVIIGFVFKVIGFFFLLGMIMKMINAINYIISGKPVVDIKTNFNSKSNKDEDKFDDFEEIN
jgi:phosphate/sulfate permease